MSATRLSDVAGATGSVFVVVRGAGGGGGGGDRSTPKDELLKLSVTADTQQLLAQAGAWRNPLQLERRVTFDAAAVKVHSVTLPCGPQQTPTPVVLVACGPSGGGSRTTEMRLVSGVTLDTLAVLRLDTAKCDAFFGASFLSATAGSDDGEKCAIVVLAQLSPHKAHRGDRNASAGGGADDGGGGRTLLLWQPLARPASFVSDEQRHSGDVHLLIALGPLPFTTPRARARPFAASSDGTLRTAGDLVCRAARCAPGSTFMWRHGALLTLDSDEQLWAASVDPPSTFPGPLYPPGFHLLTRIEHYIEREDELDIVPSAVPLAPSTATTGFVREVPRAVIDVGYAGQYPLQKLPFGVLSLGQPDDAVAATYEDNDDDDDKVPSSKRKRFKGTDGLCEQLTLVDVLPLPRRICTGDFTARLVRERAAGAATLAVCTTPAALAQRLVEFAKETAENVRKAEIRKEKSRRAGKARRQAAAEMAAMASVAAAAAAAAAATVDAAAKEAAAKEAAAKEAAAIEAAAIEAAAIEAAAIEAATTTTTAHAHPPTPFICAAYKISQVLTARLRPRLPIHTHMHTTLLPTCLFPLYHPYLPIRLFLFLT